MDLFTDIFSKFRHKLSTDRLRKSLEKSTDKKVDIYLVILSSLLCCIGINFGQKWIIALSMILYPVVDILIGLVNAIYSGNMSKISQSSSKLMGILGISFLVSMLYFFITPFSLYAQEIYSFSRVSLSVFFAEIVIGILLVKIIKTKNYSLTKAILSVISAILLLICIAGLSVKLGDFVMLQNSLKYLFLSLFFITLGIVISFMIFRVRFNEKKSVISNALLGGILLFGVYFGAQEIYTQTTNFNVEQYVYKELENRNFSVSNIEVNKRSKEVTVYYSGVKPAIAQDESLKKKYKLKNYHFVFEEVK